MSSYPPEVLVLRYMRKGLGQGPTLPWRLWKDMPKIDIWGGTISAQTYQACLKCLYTQGYAKRVIKKRNNGYRQFFEGQGQVTCYEITPKGEKLLEELGF